MKASVIVLNWNGRRHLDICLSALAAQTFRDFETIVVDNASTRDDSVQHVHANFPWVKIVELQDNLGFSGGNLAGLSVAGGEYVVLLNNDTRPESDWLERLVCCADAHPKVGIVASHLTDWEGRFTDSAGDGCYVIGLGFKRHNGRPVAEAPLSGPCFGACAGAALYRREMIGDIGFLDADFFLNHEDTDLSMRAQMSGWSCWFCREAEVRHRVSASQGECSALNMFYRTRNHFWVCVKNLPWILQLKYSPVMALVVVYMGWQAAKAGRFRDYARGLAAGVRGIQSQHGKRSLAKSKWRVGRHEIEAKLTMPRLPWTKRRRIFAQ